MSPTTSLTVQQAAAYLGERDGFLILTHRNPDGDTIGCAVGLCLALRAQGKTAWVLPNPDAAALFEPYWGDTRAPEGFTPSCVVSVDVAGLGLLGDWAAPWKDRVDLAIDHHPTHEGFAARSCVEPDSAACGEIICDIVREWGPIPWETALPLYLAIATDTGCFSYANTTAHTHLVAAALMETGIDVVEVNRRHFRNRKSYTRLRVEGRLIETAELHDGGTVALAALTLADRAALHVDESDLEDIAGVIGRIEGVETAVTIRERESGECRISVRTGPTLNAARVCAVLGGGGHAMAAGCSVRGGVDDAKREILGAIRAVQAEGQPCAE